MSMELDLSRPGLDLADLKDWSGRGQSHLELRPDEEVPLKEVRYLGRGTYGDVHEIKCKSGLLVARKRVYLQPRMQMAELRREVKLLEKLDHKHIIKLGGSYTQHPVLALILWPVAVCDLGFFLQELDSFSQNTAGDGPWQALKIPIENTPGSGRTSIYALNFLRSQMGCIANAVRYLHESGGKHTYIQEDLKPQNILLTAEGPYLTDFGLGFDFSDSSQSKTDGPLLGTSLYYSPEMLRGEARGRESDIFALGCIFLQIETLLLGKSLSDLKSIRTSTEGSSSFGQNLRRLLDWINEVPRDGRWEQQRLPLIGSMLSAAPIERPDAKEICLELYSRGSRNWLYHMPCCQSELSILLMFRQRRTGDGPEEQHAHNDDTRETKGKERLGKSDRHKEAKLRDLDAPWRLERWIDEQRKTKFGSNDEQMNTEEAEKLRALQAQPMRGNEKVEYLTNRAHHLETQERDRQQEEPLWREKKNPVALAVALEESNHSPKSFAPIIDTQKGEDLPLSESRRNSNLYERPIRRMNGLSDDGDQITKSTPLPNNHHFFESGQSLPETDAHDEDYETFIREDGQIMPRNIRRPIQWTVAEENERRRRRVNEPPKSIFT
ncbi:MAG: hypothetical protein M1825_003190 [Sarcosagium campestre]|nr:MAG: hypothetical protein M1825_003190 [Sarcosagium campestre]